MNATIFKATLVAGTLDLLSAFVFAGMVGMSPIAVLNYVASGPFGDNALHGAGWAAAGLLVHFAILTCMATVYVAISAKISALVSHPVVSGAIYGFVLWLVMYWLVKPLRWPEAPLPHTLYGIGNALFSHCILVGIPIAMIVARSVRG